MNCKPFRIKYICYGMISDGVFWLRWSLTDAGFVIKDTTKVKLRFSERNGLTKRLAIGKYSISRLRMPLLPK